MQGGRKKRQPVHCLSEEVVEKGHEVVKTATEGVHMRMKSIWIVYSVQCSIFECLTCRMCFIFNKNGRLKLETFLLYEEKKPIFNYRELCTNTTRTRGCVHLPPRKKQMWQCCIQTLLCVAMYPPDVEG